MAKDLVVEMRPIVVHESLVLWVNKGEVNDTGIDEHLGALQRGSLSRFQA